jgi:hypothetical protein
VEEEMDEESLGGGKPSSIKPPMIKPPMAETRGGALPQPPAAYQSPMQSSATPQPAQPAAASASKLLIVINIILAAALIVGIAILAYRWLK